MKFAILINIYAAYPNFKKFFLSNNIYNSLYSIRIGEATDDLAWGVPHDVLDAKVRCHKKEDIRSRDFKHDLKWKQIHAMREIEGNIMNIESI